MSLQVRILGEGATLFNKRSRKDIQKSWQDFQNGNPVGMDKVRKDILDSWNRSKQYNVNAFHLNKKLRSDADISRRRDNSITLLNAARDYLENLYLNILDRQGFVALSDSEGIIILALGDEKTIRETTAPELGLDCQEETMGTNGIGTCLVLRKPIQIWAEEHYYQGNHLWYCSGAPVFDPEGNMLGCFNVTGTSKSVHAHTLGMVMGIANAIERQITIDQIAAENQKVIRKQKIILDLITDGVLIVDPTGNVTEINHKALQLLGMAKKDIVNQPIKMLIPSGIDFNDIITHQKMLENIETDFTLPGKDLACRVSTAIIKNEQGLPESIILTFTPSKTIHALVNQVTGSMAKYTFQQMVGNSGVFQDTIRQGKRVALTNYNVLITGESGTGKELMAQAIHNASSRSQMPFIAINCGALPRGLIVSELFGYDGGSFTGSKKEGNPGKFELADGGTIFLDEIGDMPLDVQVTLLRVIQEKEVIRIGGSKPKKIDVRIIAATNKNLEEGVLNKTFRRDLFYRLNVLAINMPSLRNRQEDLELLINSILERIMSETNKPYLTIDGPALNLLKSYDWPGNIRELENVLERAANTSENFIISYHDLPINIPQGDTNASPDISIIEQTQVALIMDTLRETHGNIKQTAEKLGIARNTIYRKMERYDIPRDFGKN